MILPPALSEISGITVIDSSYVACVQDEAGIIFIFDMVKNEIKSQFIFHYPGDYEGITRADSLFYVLRSDGALFQTKRDQSPDLTQLIAPSGPPANYEGLCYDRRNHRLLIVPKNNPERDSGKGKVHPVYGLALDRVKKTGEKLPEFDLHEITRYMSDNNIEKPDDEKYISLRVSDIGIHPLTDMLYLISAVNRMLFVFDENGELYYIEKLNPDLFNMPEGISFLDNGDMLISNEGRTNPPSILLFKYRKNETRI